MELPIGSIRWEKRNVVYDKKWKSGKNRKWFRRLFILRTFLYLLLTGSEFTGRQTGMGARVVVERLSDDSARQQLLDDFVGADLCVRPVFVGTVPPPPGKEFFPNSQILHRYPLYKPGALRYDNSVSTREI